MKIAAVVFLYNFGEKEINNLLIYSEFVDVIYAYDNSECQNKKMVDKLKLLKNVIYLGGDGNQGIGHAINVAAQKCYKENIEWLFTFDQDSSIKTVYFFEFIDFLKKINSKMQIGVVVPIVNKSLSKIPIKSREVVDVTYFMQSGAAHRVSTLKQVGGYDEALFVDSVDFDYGMKLKEKGYRVIENRKIKLDHNKCDFKLYKGYEFKKYSPIRYYYITRNILVTLKRYNCKDFQDFQKKFLIEKIMNAVTIAVKEKRYIFVHACILGVIDYKCRKLGKCIHKIEE